MACVVDDATVFDFCLAAGDFEVVVLATAVLETTDLEAVVFFAETVFFDEVFLFVEVEESVAPKSEISATLNARKARKESV